jgi:hypothetical protein
MRGPEGAVLAAIDRPAATAKLMVDLKAKEHRVEVVLLTSSSSSSSSTAAAAGAGQPQQQQHHQQQQWHVATLQVFRMAPKGLLGGGGAAPLPLHLVEAQRGEGLDAFSFQRYYENFKRAFDDDDEGEGAAAEAAV